ncbi:MAG: ATP-dependent helicase HrpB [Litorilituus sp.]|jgi:ATP-dependent helicase HrpB|nr:ATP-dependent helicase HrpB [Litorilituus sp.]
MSVLPPLPIEAIQSSFCQVISEHHTVILSAPPGAGKSTCLPLWLLGLPEFSAQKIYLLQPRRLAVKNIATYLAKQLNERVGHTIGYRLRNEIEVSKHTRLEVITEGILTQIIQRDAELLHCGLVVFDEFHERSLQGDLAFALTRDVQQGLRDDLKILLMSATLDIDYLVKALPDAKVLSSEGRSFPVELHYHAPTNLQRWREHAVTIIQHQMFNHQGSILVFLPGVADIHYIVNVLSEFCPNDLLLCPLFGNLSVKEQQYAIMPCESGKRKLVLATNIAETSLTIEGVNMVIDCGLEKVAKYDSSSLMNKLVQQQIAKASATQRAGRAGRLMAGKCIRVFSKDDFERRPEHSDNDIQQADLLPTLIEAARWGVASLAELPLLELPAASKEQQAWQELQKLNLVSKQNKLTIHGEQVANLPCHPRFAHMLLMAKQSDETLVILACLLAATLEEKDIFSAEKSRFDCNISHRLDLIIARWQQPSPSMKNIIKQAQTLLKSLNVSRKRASLLIATLPLHKIGLLLAYAYPERIAKARKTVGDFVCANGKGVSLNADDALANESYIVVADLLKLNHCLKVRLAASIELTQIEHAFDSQIVDKELVRYDENCGKIIARQQRKLASLVLTEKASEQKVTPEAVSDMWCDLVISKGLNILNWQARDIALKARWQWLRDNFPQYSICDISPKSLLENLASWFAPFVGEIKSKAKLRTLDLSAMLLSQLDYAQQQILQQAAPSHYIGPTGRRCLITYSNQKFPKVSLPMQEVYGLEKTPCVGIIHNEQGIPLVLELLSPAQRPIQVTQNLTEFWLGSYKAVQKDMKSRYPKHYWPDDPANAKATNKTKRYITDKNTDKK